MPDRYGRDVLATDWPQSSNGHGRTSATPVPARRGEVVEEVMTGFCGEIVTIDRDLGVLTLEDRHRVRRTFPLGPGFLLDGEPVELLPPVTRAAPAASTRTASGSVAVRGAAARVARESRIFVEGRHDAELVEKVWGDDLRIEGVVVEYLGGVDDLAALIEQFGPGPGRRVGVLVDHLVAGSKESRIADEVRRNYGEDLVLVTGHPFVDIWQAVDPARLGIAGWPAVPRGEDWKTGTCRRLGWPARDQADIARAWRHVLGGVRGFQDLDPALLGRVEELIDFVTAA